MKLPLKSSFLAAVLLSAVLGCDSTEEDVAQVDDTSIGFGLDDAFSSKSEFERALSKTGTGQGNNFSGSHTVLFRGGRFSTDCTPEFARRNDFYVNTGASDAELNQLFSETAPDYEINDSIVQQGGRLTLDAEGDGPEAPLTGWIDADGSFLALLGQYDDDRNYWVAGHAGRIQGSRIEGAFASRVKWLDDVEVTGSCTWSADMVPANSTP